jgi:hypothetical protein
MDTKDIVKQIYCVNCLETGLRNRSLSIVINPSAKFDNTKRMVNI